MILPTASLWDLFGLDVEPGAQWSVQWSPPWPAWVTAIIVLPLLAAFVAYCYRRHQTPGTRGRRLLLAATRFAVLVGILAILFDPMLAVETQLTRRSTVAVLVDDSLSMTFEDLYPDVADQDRLVRAAGWVLGDGPVPQLARERLRTTPRWKVVDDVWAQSAPQFVDRLARSHTVKVYGFSTRLRRDPVLDPALAVAPAGAHTKLGDAIRDVLDDLKGQPIAAIVVLSDGRHNAGEHTPLEAAAAAAAHGRGVPVFTVGVGSPVVPADVRLDQVKAPDVVLSDEQVKIEFGVAHTGFAGDRITVELHTDGPDGPLVADTQIELADQEQTSQRGILKVRPFAEPGEYELVLHIPPDPRDTVPENNTKRLRIRVVDGKLKVLYVDGRPRFEYRHLSLALTRDERIAANVLLADSDDGVEQRHSPGVPPLAEFPRTETGANGQPGLFDYDVLIIGDVAFDAGRAIGIFAEPAKQMKMVERFVEEVGGGVVFLAGPDANPWRYADTPLATLLPVELLPSDELGRTGAEALSDEEVKPEVTAAGDGHVLLQLHPDTSSEAPNKLLWRDLRGFFWTAPVRGPKLHASVLLENPDQGSVYGRRPVLATMWYGRGRTVFVGTDEIWRWRELQGDRYYYRFFSNLIRFVGNNRLLGDERRFEITLEKTAFTLGERVVVRARVWDEGFQKLTADEVELQHEAGDAPPQPLRLEKVPGRDGEYEGSLVAGRLGPHRLWFDIAHGSEQGRAAVTSFDVAVPQREMENPALDAGTMQTIWDESGATAAATEAGAKRATFFRLWELPLVAAAVPERSVVLTGVDATYRLWDTWLVFALILVLLCLEWIVRKLTRLP